MRLQGNKYFSRSDLLKESAEGAEGRCLSAQRTVQPRAGDRDEKTIQALYRANGFNDAKVTAR